MWLNIRHLLFLILVTTAWAQNSKMLATKQLLARLREAPRGYDPQIRPPAADWEPTEVQVQAYIRDLNVDDVTMTVTYELIFRMMWNDSRLTYNAAQGVDYVTLLDPDLVWLPDAFFRDGAVMQHSSIHPETYIRVFHDTRVLYSTRVTVKAKCSMSLQAFPHDGQECGFSVASYGYTTDDLVLTPSRSDPVQVSKATHLEGYLVDAPAMHSFTSHTSTGEYSDVQVSVRLHRVFAPHLLTCYLPTLLLVLVAWSAFLLPSDSFLPRLLLSLLPLLALVLLAKINQVPTPTIPYVSAHAIFTGAAACVLLLTLLQVVFFGRGGEDAIGKVKDQKVAGGDGVVMVMRGLLRDKAALSRAATITTYIFFLVVYFLAYCA